MYLYKGEYEKALENYNKCLEIRTRVLGPESIDVATTLSRIGVVYFNKGEYEKALENHKKCLQIQTIVLGP